MIRLWAYIVAPAILTPVAYGLMSDVMHAPPLIRGVVIIAMFLPALLRADDLEIENDKLRKRLDRLDPK